MLVEKVMIFRSCKCQNKNFSQTEAHNFEGLLRYQKSMCCYDFCICCEPLNEKNFKLNFVSFGVKLKSYDFSKFDRSSCRVVEVPTIWEINWMG
jgi:hypothetical protein